MKKSERSLDVERIIKRTVDIILKEDKEHNVKAILLFGSHADKTAIWRSDIDICVIFKKDLTDQKAFLFRKKMMGLIPDVVDLQVFNVLPSKIKKAIAEKHHVLFQTNNFNDATFTRVNLELFFEFKHNLRALEA